nr:MAG: hypothetical protein [Molluscum contagiosum virus]
MHAAPLRSAGRQWPLDQPRTAAGSCSGRPYRPAA